VAREPEPTREPDRDQDRVAASVSDDIHVRGVVVARPCRGVVVCGVCVVYLCECVDGRDMCVCCCVCACGMWCVVCCMCCMCGMCGMLYGVFVAQWIRHPPTKREIAGSSPVEDFLFCFCFCFCLLFCFCFCFCFCFLALVLFCLCQLASSAPSYLARMNSSSPDTTAARRAPPSIVMLEAAWRVHSS
jgi:hypothetical protein